MTILVPNPGPGQEVSDESWELEQVIGELGTLTLLEYVAHRVGVRDFRVAGADTPPLFGLTWTLWSGCVGWTHPVLETKTVQIERRS